MEASGQSTCSANIATKLSWSQLQEIPPRRTSAPHSEQLCRGRSKRAGWQVCMQLTPSTGLIIYVPTKPHYHEAILGAVYVWATVISAGGCGEPSHQLHPSLPSLQLWEPGASFRADVDLMPALSPQPSHALDTSGE